MFACVHASGMHVLVNREKLRRRRNGLKRACCKSGECVLVLARYMKGRRRRRGERFVGWQWGGLLLKGLDKEKFQVQ